MRNFIHAFSFAAVAALVTSSPAQADDDTPARRGPALVVAIAVDQFSADLFARYRRSFTGGLARLQQGAVFPNGFQSHAATETCPGHSTILTGDHPARTGIVANNWFEPGIARDDKRVYCAEDETNPASRSSNPVVSSRHLRVPTLGDLIKQSDPASRNVAVSAKDRAAVMMSGHTADAAYWYKDGAFTTFAGRQPSAAGRKVNAEMAAAVAAGSEALPVPGQCAASDRAVAVGDMTIGTYRFALKAGDADAFGHSPRIDAATGDLAIALVDEMSLGRDTAPDVLSVSFSATDYIGHAFGTAGVEMCIQLSRLDATIGRLLDALDERGIDYVAMLTADHGGIDAPERLNEQAYPQAQRMSADLEMDALGRAVSAKTGIRPASGALFYGSGGSGDIYLSAGLTAKQQRKVVAALVETLRATPQVEAVFTADQLAAMPVPEGDPQDWTMAERVRASFDPERSGQVLVMTKRGVVPVKPRPGLTTTHGSPWDYDRRVPILFWRKGLPGFEQPDPVQTVDIAPTLAAILGLDLAEGTFDGRCLDIDGGPGDICR